MMIAAWIGWTLCGTPAVGTAPVTRSLQADPPVQRRRAWIPRRYDRYYPGPYYYYPHPYYHPYGWNRPRFHFGYRHHPGFRSFRRPYDRRTFRPDGFRHRGYRR